MHIVLRSARAAMTEELMQRLADGKITARNVESQRRSAFRGGRKAKNRLRKTLGVVADTGLGHVAEEIQRQVEE